MSRFKAKKEIKAKFKNTKKKKKSWKFMLKNKKKRNFISKAIMKESAKISLIKIRSCKRRIQWFNKCSKNKMSFKIRLRSRSKKMQKAKKKIKLKNLFWMKISKFLRMLMNINSRINKLMIKNLKRV